VDSVNLESLEKEIGELPPLLNKLIKKPTSEDLQFHGYAPHRGLRFNSEHWRKIKKTGCFHITLHKNGKCRMHWDAWDPRRYPIRHCLEILDRYLFHSWLYLVQP